MHSSTSLYDALRKSIVDLDKQIEAAKESLEKEIEALPEEYDSLSIYEMKYQNGQFVMADLIIAKTTALASLANLKAADMNNRTRR